MLLYIEVIWHRSRLRLFWITNGNAKDSFQNEILGQEE
jgi:hypothetical protein